MQLLSFQKYQGTGNDFIIVDNRNRSINLSEITVKSICDRRYGIGADGLILLEVEDMPYMVYYNSDGKKSTMCGNGGRCFTAFAASLNLTSAGKDFEFMAIDGVHRAMINPSGVLRLSMSDTKKPVIYKNGVLINTGSPHYVEISTVQELKKMNISERGSAIRYNEDFRNEGINVNFIAFSDEGVYIRTYERGVENETLSCGTGAVAAAIVSSLHKKINPVKIIAPGGNLYIYFKEMEFGFTNILLEGPAEFVFSGHIKIND